MLKKILFGSLLLIIIAALVYGAALRSIETTGTSEITGGGRGQGGGGRGGGGWGNTTQTNPSNGSQLPADTSSDHLDLSTLTLAAGPLSQQEIDGLLYVREEEKLARDVYLALGQLWGLQNFTNIARSEQSHMDSMLVLLEGYGVKDPVGDAPAGKFSDPELQGLYNQLIAQGSQSLSAALKVGAAIEEIDILDLRKWDGLTSNTSLETVYTALENGSKNHLRAFTGNLVRRGGETYQPKYLSQADYLAIVN